MLEVAIVDYVLGRVEAVDGAEAQRGTERGYPDIEVSGGAFGEGFHAIDVKVARLAPSGNRTQSRVTLYTGNTYFRYPTLRRPGTFRPFRDYASHLDILGVYAFDPDSRARVDHLELIVPRRVVRGRRAGSTGPSLPAGMLAP